MNIEDLNNTFNDLMIRAQTILSKPIVNLGSTVNKWVFATSVLSRMIGRIFIVTLSPLKISTNFTLAFGFSVGTFLIEYFLKTHVSPVPLSGALASQLVVHTLGFGSALQLQSYRRKSFKAYMDEKDAKEMVAYLANIDPLTKSLTRRQLFNIAESEFLRYSRYHRPLSILVMDADHFKNINDSYGHHAGDIVLRSLSLVALEQKRAQDTFGRLGGEEFGLILPETNLEQARVVAERIQKTWGPLKRAFDELRRASETNDALRFAAHHRSAFMCPWEEEPRSIAYGILDDETHDWLAVVEGMLTTGGDALVVDEETLEQANALARGTTGIEADHTGSAGLAGLLALRATGGVADDECVTVLFTGVVRAVPAERRERDEELPRAGHPVAERL